LILEGAIPAAVLALLVQGLFGLAERRFVPLGLRLKPNKAVWQTRFYSLGQDFGRSHIAKNLYSAGAFQTMVIEMGETVMPRGDKSKYTDKQKRKAEHIEEGYETRGVPEQEAERRAWATVNKESGGGKRGGSGAGKPESHGSSRKGGKIGGRASAARPASERSAAAKKAAATRKRRAS
jgi:plasmid stabilization system protein ParE